MRCWVRLQRYGVPEQILTDNGKVFTGRFGPGGSSSEVLFDRVCVENGIRHLLTAPRSPTTTGKVERLHKTMRAEFFADADRVFATIGELQAALDGWVAQYNTERPHQSLGMRPPAERFALAAGPDLEVVDPVAAVASKGQTHAASQRGDLRCAGVQRWVDQRGSIRLAGFGYRVPIVLAGEPVEAVVADNLVQIYHRERAGRLACAAAKPPAAPRLLRQGRRSARAATSGIVVTRMVDNNGDVSFAGTMYRAGGLGGEKKSRYPSLPGRCRSPVMARSCAPTPSATTGPRSTAHTPHRMAVPASPARMRPTALTAATRERLDTTTAVSAVKHLPELIRQAGAET